MCFTGFVAKAEDLPSYLGPATQNTYVIQDNKWQADGNDVREQISGYRSSQFGDSSGDSNFDAAWFDTIYCDMNPELIQYIVSAGRPDAGYEIGGSNFISMMPRNRGEFDW